MTMKGRLARAMVSAMQEQFGSVIMISDNVVSIEGDFDLIALTEAVIDAMREPTEAMIKVGTDKMPEYRDFDDRDEKYFREWYAAVIDAAKSETPNLSTAKPAGGKT